MKTEIVSRDTLELLSHPEMKQAINLLLSRAVESVTVSVDGRVVTIRLLHP